MVVMSWEYITHWYSAPSELYYVRFSAQVIQGSLRSVCMICLVIHNEMKTIWFTLVWFCMLFLHDGFKFSCSFFLERVYQVYLPTAWSCIRINLGGGMRPNPCLFLAVSPDCLECYFHIQDIHWNLEPSRSLFAFDEYLGGRGSSVCVVFKTKYEKIRLC